MKGEPTLAGLNDLIADAESAVDEEPWELLAGSRAEGARQAEVLVGGAAFPRRRSSRAKRAASSHLGRAEQAAPSVGTRSGSGVGGGGESVG